MSRFDLDMAWYAERMTRKIEFAENEYYHIYNRGTEKRNVFRHNRDREHFLAGLYLSNSTKTHHISNYRDRTLKDLLEIERGAPIVDICAYCLMPNHFHLLLRERSAGGVSHFMQKLITGYTMYFNILNERTGALFQGKYKVEHIDSDRYLKYLIAYIGLNPIKLIEPRWREIGIKSRSDIAEYLDSYRFSSFPDYSGQQRSEGKIIDKSALPDYFKTLVEFRSNVFDWLDYNA